MLSDGDGADMRYFFRLILFWTCLGITEASSSTISYHFDFDTESVVNVGFLEAAGISAPVYELSATLHFDSDATPYFEYDVSGEYQGAKYNFVEFSLSVNENKFFSSSSSVLGDINVVDSLPGNTSSVPDSTVIFNDADIPTSWGFIDRIVISLFSSHENAITGTEVPTHFELQQIASSATQSELYISAETSDSTVILVTPRVASVTISELTTAVPAPAAFPLLISGLIGLFMLGRWRKVSYSFES